MTCAELNFLHVTTKIANELQIVLDKSWCRIINSIKFCLPRELHCLFNILGISSYINAIFKLRPENDRRKGLWIRHFLWKNYSSELKLLSNVPSIFFFMFINFLLASMKLVVVGILISFCTIQFHWVVSKDWIDSKLDIYDNIWLALIWFAFTLVGHCMWYLPFDLLLFQLKLNVSALFVFCIRWIYWLCVCLFMCYVWVCAWVSKHQTKCSFDLICMHIFAITSKFIVDERQEVISTEEYTKYTKCTSVR